MNTTKDTLDHDSHDGRVEHPATDTVSILDRPVPSVDAERPTLVRPSPRRWLGWVLVVAALVAVAALAVSLLVGNDGRPSHVGDAKDHPGYGPLTPFVADSVSDAKDHPGYGPLTPIAPRTRDDIVRDLVARGIVPAATLDDGTWITSPALAPRTRDDIVRDLVARGVVPAATLDDGSQITSPSLEP